MAAGASAAARAAERNLVITRVLAAPRDLVFKTWTERQHLVHWSAPRGFTITHCEGDARPGGSWRCCMQSPSGVDYWVGGVWREIVVPERLVFTHAWDDEDGRPGPETLVTVTFAERGRRTELTVQQARFGAMASRDAHHEGWSEGLDGFAGWPATA